MDKVWVQSEANQNGYLRDGDRRDDQTRGARARTSWCRGRSAHGFDACSDDGSPRAAMRSDRPMTSRGSPGREPGVAACRRGPCEAGDAAGAEKICRRALRETPDAPQLLGHARASLIEQERPGRRRRNSCGAPCVSYPAPPQAHEGLGEALLLQNRLHDALASLEMRTAPRTRPAVGAGQDG
jgi:hypothetical protein